MFFSSEICHDVQLMEASVRTGYRNNVLTLSTADKILSGKTDKISCHREQYIMYYLLFNWSCVISLH